MAKLFYWINIPFTGDSDTEGIAVDAELKQCMAWTGLAVLPYRPQDILDRLKLSLQRYMRRLKKNGHTMRFS
jgi:hypothetical protein